MWMKILENVLKRQGRIWEKKAKIENKLGKLEI